MTFYPYWHIIPLLCVLIVGPAQIVPLDPHSSTCTIPIREVRGLAFVEVTHRNRKLVYLLDTGFSNSFGAWQNWSTAGLDSPPSAMIGVRGGASTVGTCTWLDHIEIVESLPPTRPDDGTALQGVMGFPALDGAVVTWHGPAMELSIDRFPRLDGRRSMDLVRRGQQIGVACRVAGQCLDLLLDSGFTGDVLVRKNRLTAPLRAASPAGAVGVGWIEPVTLGLLDIELFGDSIEVHAAVSDAAVMGDWDGALGLRLLGRAVLTFDFVNDVVYLGCPGEGAAESAFGDQRILAIESGTGPPEARKALAHPRR